MRDDNGSRFSDPMDMEIILSHFDFVAWVFSPVGLVTLVAGAGLLLSGLPGTILSDVAVSASARRSIHRPKAPGSEATSCHHRERMDV